MLTMKISNNSNRKKQSYKKVMSERKVYGNKVQQRIIWQPLFYQTSLIKLKW